MTCKGKISSVRVTIFIFLLSLPLATTSYGIMFWNEDFENHLYPNWLGGNDCITATSPDGQNCGYPRITTAQAHSGTHSIWSHYTDPGVQIGTYINRAHADVDSIYMRWWQKYSAGSTLLEKEHKTMINQSSAAWFYWRHNNGDTRLGGGGWTLKQSYTCPNGQTVPVGDTCNMTPNIASIPIVDGKWHCIEIHAGLGTVGGANGVLETWIDGTLTTRYTNLPIRGDSGKFNVVSHYAQYGAVGDRYVDDLAVGDTRIGCGATASPTTNTTGPPATPTNLTVN